MMLIFSNSLVVFDEIPKHEKHSINFYGLNRKNAKASTKSRGF